MHVASCVGMGWFSDLECAISHSLKQYTFQAVESTYMKNFMYKRKKTLNKVKTS